MKDRDFPSGLKALALVHIRTDINDVEISLADF